MRLVLVALALALAVPAPEAVATPENWLACSRAAQSMKTLRQCSTAREDIAFCETQRAGQGIEGPIFCLEDIVRQWTNVASSEEAFVPAGPERPEWLEWLAERDALCRDAEQIRIQTERFGPGYAGFEAAKCELNQTVRRAIDSVARQRGLR